MKFKGLIFIVFGLLMASCKSQKSIASSGKTAVLLVKMKKSIQPEELQGKSPFLLLDKLPKDRTINKWELTFDLGALTEQELVNYLINLDKVVSVGDLSKAVTPPVRKSKAPTQSKRQ